MKDVYAELSALYVLFSALAIHTATTQWDERDIISGVLWLVGGLWAVVKGIVAFRAGR